MIEPAAHRDILWTARNLIAAPEMWTRRASARDAEGNPVWAISPDAVRWSALGAIVRATAGHHRFHEAVNVLQGHALGGGISDVNDGPGGHAHVLALFDRAISGCGA